VAKMTDEEADALDELMSNIDLELGPNGTGFFYNKRFQMIALDENTPMSPQIILMHYPLLNF
jgi:hypothetical protein